MSQYAYVDITLLSLTLSVSVAETNITLLSFPVNLTSWKVSLREALNNFLTRPLEGLNVTWRGYLEFLRNGSISCAEEGEECIPGTPTCCLATKDDEEDLQCLPNGDSYSCGRLTNSEDLAEQRLNALEFGDSTGMVASHPWAYSWEFQSKSAMEREEEEAAEEAEWKKNWKPSSKENFWVKVFRKMKNAGDNFWNDLRKMKKLKEVKECLQDKHQKRIKKVGSVEDGEKGCTSEGPVVNPGGREENIYSEETSEKIETNDVQEDKSSEESFIKFSDEIPKRENKIDFRIDDIINDAAKLVHKKIKEKGKQQTKHASKEERTGITSPSSSADQPFHLDAIDDSEDKLIKEISELKKLKEQKLQNDEKQKPIDQDIDKLIERQVKIILEEERRLDKLRKIEELRRLEEGMKQDGQINP